MHFSFAIDWIGFSLALIFAVCFYALYKKFSVFPSPHIKFSQVEKLREETSLWQRRLYLSPLYFRNAALALFLIAFIDPHFFLPRPQKPGEKPPQQPLEGIAIYLILDQSGSMEEKVEEALPDGSHRSISKIAMLREVTQEFVKNRPNDMIGIIGFSRGAQVLDPLTLDHQAILDQLSKLDIQRAKDQEGTSIGYAIYKTANLIAATRHYAEDLHAEGLPAYSIKSSIMILITDGVPEPNPLDKGKRLRNMGVPEAAAYAKQEGIRLYIINVDPGFIAPEFEPFRVQMKAATESTGGRFFIMSGGTNLSQIYQDIDKLEKSKLPGQPEILNWLHQNVPKDKLPNLYQRISLYPWLIFLGLCSLLIYLLLETIWMRKVP